MEIREYWNDLGRRRWVLLIAPLVAGVVAVAFGLAQPPSYDGVAVVHVPVEEGAAETPSTARQVISDFEAVVNSAEFADEFAEASGLPREGAGSGVRVAQVGTGLVVQLRYRANAPGPAASGSATAGRLAVELYFAPKVAEARAYLDAAEAQRDDAESALEGFVTDAGVGQPEVSYNAVLRVLEELRVRAAMAEAEGSAAIAAGLRPALDKWESRAADAGALARRYQSLAAVRDRAEKRVANAEERVTTAESMEALAGQDAVVATGPARLVSTRSSVTQLAGGAVILSVLASCLLLLALEFLAHPRRRPSTAIGHKSHLGGEPRPAVEQRL